MMELVNEVMAVLGFAIPSAVLWQVWMIKASYDRTQELVEQIAMDVAYLKRKREDEDLIDLLTK